MELLIDFNWLFNNRLYAFNNLTNSEGIPTGGMYGILKVHEMIANKGYNIVACLDGNPIERKTLFEDYKANREQDEFRTNAKKGNQTLFEILNHLGWKFYKDDEKEADDLIASRAMENSKKGIETIIYSSDKDLQQLMVFPNVKITSKIEKGQFVFKTNQDVIDKIGCEPRYQRWMRPARGDSSDNIPSAVPRVQAKVILPVVKDIEDGVMLGLTLPESYHRAVEKHKDSLTKNAYEKLRNGINQYCINFQIMDLLKWYHQPIEMKQVQFRELSDDMIILMLDRFEMKEFKEWYINKSMFGDIKFGGLN